MLSHSNLPLSCWSYAIAATIHIINRFPTLVLHKQSLGSYFITLNLTSLTSKPLAVPVFLYSNHTIHINFNHIKNLIFFLAILLTQKGTSIQNLPHPEFTFLGMFYSMNLNFYHCSLILYPMILLLCLMCIIGWLFCIIFLPSLPLLLSLPSPLLFHLLLVLPQHPHMSVLQCLLLFLSKPQSYLLFLIQQIIHLRLHLLSNPIHLILQLLQTPLLQQMFHLNLLLLPSHLHLILQILPNLLCSYLILSLPTLIL